MRAMSLPTVLLLMLSILFCPSVASPDNNISGTFDQQDVGLDPAAGVSSIVTGKNFLVNIKLTGDVKGKIKIAPSSEVIINPKKESRLDLVHGSLCVLLANVPEGDPFEVRTPQAVCSASGTGWMTSVRAGVTTVSVFDDKVYVIGIDENGDKFS